MISKKKAMMATLLLGGVVSVGVLVYNADEKIYASNKEDTVKVVEEYKEVCSEENIEVDVVNIETPITSTAVDVVKTEEELVVTQIGIELDTSKFKTEYLRGDIVDTSMIVVNAVLSDNTAKILDREYYNISSVNTSKCGEQVITVTNGDFSKEVKISIGYTTEDVEDYTMYSSTNLNLREGPGTEFKAVGALSINDEVKVIEKADNGWVKVIHKEKDYFCSEKYLMKEKKIIESPVVNNSGTYDSSIMHFDGSIPQDRKNKAISLYNHIPQNVLDAVKNDGYTIWVSSSSQYTDGHCGTFYPAGYDWGIGTGKIAVYAKSVWAVDIAVIHETGHWMDNYLGRKEGWGHTGHYKYVGVTSDPVWIGIFNSEVGASGYPSWANYCPEEYFAESVWKALTKPSWCKQTLPRTYEYVMNCINRVN